MAQARMVRRRASTPTTGWTLVEMLVALSVFATLLALAVPAWQALNARQRQQSAASRIESHVAMARSTAISRNARVTMSPLQPGDWAGGWRLHVDDNTSGTWDDGEALLAHAEPLSGVAASAEGPLGRYLSFDASGAPVQMNGAFLAGTWVLCSARDQPAVRLVLSASGRVRREQEPLAVCP
ncbi:GspH/FimT family pseudopilin [Methylibium rhizosphaerae]|uniref:GspH/FimT family pseudopilin n=1 Tax=Methylibium rhizosphaerae TaxID=2570323 RepID=UPI0015E32E1C|nr:GspH/FimT family pseudopilin [Methylibium rhizosphaerae]